MGRPLDVNIQVMLAQGESEDGLCLRPEVLFGESPVSQVTVEAQRLSPGADLTLRVQTSVPVNEPFVTINLTAGCAGAFTRSYVLLADPESLPVVAAGPAPTPAPATAPLPVAPVASVPLAPAEPVATAQPRPSGRVAPAARQGRAPAKGAAAAPKKPTPASTAGSVVRKPRPPAPAAAPTGPRLKLDPIDLGPVIEREPALRMSPLILAEPTTNEQTRQAAAATWKAINATPEEVLKDAHRVAALETEARQLREQVARNSEQLAALQGRIEEGAWYRTLSLILGGALLAVLIAGLWVWRRSGASGGAPAWWAGTAKTADQSGEAEEERTLRKQPTPLPASLRDRKPMPVDLDLSLDEDSASGHARVAAAGAVKAALPKSLAETSPRRDIAAGGASQDRSVATEELFDVQQQADFFVSLGQHEQAISILKAHLDESHEPSPLAFLDLLNIYHTLGRRDEYETLREEFNQVFNAGAPPFDDFAQGSRGLESYEAAFSRIQALWPHRRVLDLIERSIFRDPMATDGEVFDLAAYRELLFLHAVAKEIVDVPKDDDEIDVAVADFQHTALKPLKVHPPAGGQVGALTEGDRATEPMQDALPMSSNIGLDVDLDALSALSALEVALPDLSTTTALTDQSSSVPPLPVPQEPGAGSGKMADLDFLDFVLPAEDMRTPPKK
ncbi:MAG: FimV family protein [Gammaproteobacteria bacterium]